MNDDWQPTTRLRFVNYTSPLNASPVSGARKILQQWWAPNMPAYMQDPTVGEWRDVPLMEESP
jgi:hypothetical protein